ncbi:MAG: DUF3144 domain-containing protein [Cellvibrio sp.]
MADDTDEKFFARADAHIHLANEHLSDAARGKVSASFMYAASRFNAWVSAADLQSQEELQSKREEILDYFVGQYRAMLEENLDNYIEHFDTFMNTKVN